MLFQNYDDVLRYNHSLAVSWLRLELIALGIATDNTKYTGPKLPPLRCTVPGSRIRDRRTGTAQNGYLGQKREHSADQRGTIQKPHLKLVTTKSAALQVRWATTL
jgi:hypothetical protein